MYVANVAEDGFENNPHLDKLTELAKRENAPIVAICAALESEIADLQQQLNAIETKISNPSDYAAEINSGELYTQYNDIKNTIEEKEMEWLELQDN